MDDCSESVDPSDPVEIPCPGALESLANSVDLDEVVGVEGGLAGLLGDSPVPADLRVPTSHLHRQGVYRISSAVTRRGCG